MSTSRQPTRIGLPRPTAMAWSLGLLGLAVLAAAINTGNNLLYLVFGLLAAALPVSLAFSLVNLARLSVEVCLPPPPRAGAPFTVRLRVHNHGRRFAARALQLRLVTPDGVLGTALIERVAAGGSQWAEISTRLPRRGAVEVRGARLQSIYPLSFVQRRRFFPCPGEILVLPAATLARRSRWRGTPRAGLAGQSAGTAGDEYKGLRRGLPEDDARRVDWKSTARRGALVVRETTGEGSPEVDLDLTTRMTGEAAAARRLFERQVERTAATMQQVIAAGGTARLSVDDGGSRPYAGVSGLQEGLRRLARLQPTDAGGTVLPPLKVLEPVQVPAAIPPRATPPGRTHAASALAALAVSTAALFAFDGLGGEVFVVLLVALAVVVYGKRRLPRGPVSVRLWQAAAVLALLYFFVDLVLLRRNPLSASLNLVAFITLYKLFNSKDVRDDRQILLVSLLQMILAAALTTDISFVVPLVAWLLAATHAQAAWTALGPEKREAGLATVHDPRRRRYRYAGSAVAASTGLLTIGAVIFLIVPHLGTGAFAQGALGGVSISGFSGTAVLGDIGRIKLSGARVMRVEVDGDLPPGVDLRWRGVAMGEFDGRAWSRVGYGHAWLSVNLDGKMLPRGEPLDPGVAAAAGTVVPTGSSRVVQRVRLEPGASLSLFSVARPLEISSDDFFFLAEDEAGSLLLPRQVGRRVSYTVVSAPPRADAATLSAARGADPLAVRRRHLALPRVDRRIAPLVASLVEGQPTRYDAAVVLRDWLSTNLQYSLAVNDGDRDDPLAAFLFDGMAAHCEYFATAMVVMARSAGIPARFVAGYLRGESNRFSNSYTVRQSDAHSWVEIYFPGVGWVAFDPTPSAGLGSWAEQGLLDAVGDAYSTVARWWDDYVIGIDLADQLDGALALREFMGTAAASLRQAISLPVGSGPGWRRLAVVLAAVLALCGIVLLAVRAGRRRRRLPAGGGRPPVFYLRLLRLLRQRGLVRQPAETPAAFARRAARLLPVGAAARVRDLTELYYQARFGGVVDGLRLRRLAQVLLQDIRQDLRRPRTA